MCFESNLEETSCLLLIERLQRLTHLVMTLVILQRSHEELELEERNSSLT